MANFLEDVDRSGDFRTMADDAGALDLDGTRRDLLKRAGIAGAAAVGGSAALGLLNPWEAAAQTRLFSRRRKSASNDIVIGNYALVLEYLEAAYYTAAVESGQVTDPNIVKFATTVRDHEVAHVAALKKILGRRAVKAPELNLAAYLTDQATILKTAATVEPVGVAAYAGAAPYIFSADIVVPALGIHSVEANHAAWAAALLVSTGIDPTAEPAPNIVNPAFTQKKVNAIVRRLDVLA